MAKSARRRHLANRLKVMADNLLKHEEDFTLDKRMERALDKMESRNRHMLDTANYRRARREAAESALKQEAIESQLAEEEAELEKDTEQPFEESAILAKPDVDTDERIASNG